MLQHAFKEWAVICKALATGRQALILRKGGISEPDAQFGIVQTRFWLFPTYLHQDHAGLQERAWPLLDEVLAQKPQPDAPIRFSHFAEVTGIYRVRDEMRVMMLGHLHLWSAETVAKRYHYRVPELYVLPVRIWQVPNPVELPNTPYYDGCRSWVELERALPMAGATAVLPDSDLEDLHRQLDLLLNPSTVV